MADFDIKANSSILLSGRDRAAARSFLKGIGYTDADLQKPIVGIANTWTETMPCNFNLRQLAVRVKEGVRAAGGTPMEFNTVAVSDGITMGTEGMKASLVSRELIADSMELMARAYFFDAMITLVACDKTIPAGAMALLRTNLPGLLVYGGCLQRLAHPRSARRYARPGIGHLGGARPTTDRRIDASPRGLDLCRRRASSRNLSRSRHSDAHGIDRDTQPHRGRGQERGIAFRRPHHSGRCHHRSAAPGI